MRNALLYYLDEAQTAAATLSLKLGTAETRIRELEAANERLLSLVCQWSESCTGRHGSQTQCVESCSPPSTQTGASDDDEDRRERDIWLDPERDTQ